MPRAIHHHPTENINDPMPCRPHDRLPEMPHRHGVPPEKRHWRLPEARKCTPEVTYGRKAVANEGLTRPPGYEHRLHRIINRILPIPLLQAPSLLAAGIKNQLRSSRGLAALYVQLRGRLQGGFSG